MRVTAAEVHEQLDELLSLLRGIRGPVRKRIPETEDAIPAFVVALLDALTSLTMLQTRLVRRALRTRTVAEAWRVSPGVEDALLNWVEDDPRRITARKATDRLLAVFVLINDGLGLMSEEEIGGVPENSSDIPELLALVTAAIDHLTRFLYLDLVLRLWPDQGLVAEATTAWRRSERAPT